ncbi:KIF6 [Symbiodinium sp. CCMP2456]|nr:KIF6 [Symbiodinium sp. CCMP2456]
MMTKFQSSIYARPVDRTSKQDAKQKLKQQVESGRVLSVGSVGWGRVGPCWRIGNSLIEVRQGPAITAEDEVEQWLAAYQLQKYAALLREKGFKSLEEVQARLLEEIPSMLSTDLPNEDYQVLESAAKEIDRMWPSESYPAHSLEFYIRPAEGATPTSGITPPEDAPPPDGDECSHGVVATVGWAGGTISLVPAGVTVKELPVETGAASASGLVMRGGQHATSAADSHLVTCSEPDTLTDLPLTTTSATAKDIAIVVRGRDAEKALLEDLDSRRGLNDRVTLTDLNTLAPEIFRFDRVFLPGTPQENVFREVAKEAVNSALDEVPESALFLALGAQGSGKSYAVTGGAKHFADRGLIPRCVTALFEAIAGREDMADFTVQISFFEIYQGRLNDLMGPPNAAPRRWPAASETVAFKLLCHGDVQRKLEAGPQSPDSSRSHVVFALHLLRACRDVSTLAFVDVAAHAEEVDAALGQLQEATAPASHSLAALLSGWLPGTATGLLPPASSSRLVLLHMIRFTAPRFAELRQWLHLAEALRKRAESESKAEAPPELRGRGKSGRLAFCTSGMDSPTATTRRTKSSSPQSRSDDIDLVAAMDLSPLSWWAKLLQNGRHQLQRHEKAPNGDLQQQRPGAGGDGAEARPAAVNAPIFQAVEGPVVSICEPVTYPVSALQTANWPSYGTRVPIQKRGLLAVVGAGASPAPARRSPNHPSLRLVRSVSPQPRAGGRLSLSPVPAVMMPAASKDAAPPVSVPAPLQAPVLSFEPVSHSVVRRVALPIRTTLPSALPGWENLRPQVSRHTVNGPLMVPSAPGVLRPTAKVHQLSRQQLHP